MEKPRPTSWDLLAGVRFALASIVVCGHVGWLGAPSPTFTRICDFCPFTAVLCFLVISGYSMADSIGSRADGFLVRRLARICPLYALAVFAALLPAILLGMASHRTSHDLVLNLLFLQGYRSFPIVGNGAVWSLAVEAGFYALTPLLARLKTGVLLGLAGLSAVAFAVFPHLHLDYYGGLTHGQPMLFLGSAWLSGFIYYRSRHLPLAGAGLVTAMVLLTTVNAAFTHSDHEITIVVSMLAVVASAGGVRLPVRAGRAMAYLGELSFPLYLFHAPVVYVVVQYLHCRNPWVPTGIAVAIGMAMLVVDRRVKRPFTRAVEAVVALPQPVVAYVAAEARGALAAVRPLAVALFARTAPRIGGDALNAA